MAITNSKYRYKTISDTQSNDLTEKDIQLAKTDIGYFDKVYDYYFDDCYRFAMYLSKNREIAEDIVSESFVKVIRNLENFRGSKKSFKSWLFKIIKNTYFDYLKANRIIVNNEIIENQASKENFEISEDIKYLLRMLPAQSQLILYLKYSFGLDASEIASIVGLTHSNTRKVISRSIDFLRKLYGQHK